MAGSGASRLAKCRIASVRVVKSDDFAWDRALDWFAALPRMPNPG